MERKKPPMARVAAIPSAVRSPQSMRASLPSERATRVPQPIHEPRTARPQTAASQNEKRLSNDWVPRLLASENAVPYRRRREGTRRGAPTTRSAEESRSKNQKQEARSTKSSAVG